MKIVRPNMADLARTFTSSGESDSKAAPETSIDMPASIMPIMEFCRPVGVETFPSATVPSDVSVYSGVTASVAAGAAALSDPLITLRRGIWRIIVQGTLSVSGAIATGDNHAILALVGPDGLFGVGTHLLQHQIGSIYGSNDFLIHLPTDQWSVSFELTDPVTALSVSRFRGSLYCCHLL